MKPRIIFILIAVLLLCPIGPFSQSTLSKIEKGVRANELKIEHEGKSINLDLESKLKKDAEKGVFDDVYGKAAIDEKSEKIAIPGISVKGKEKRLILFVASSDGKDIRKIVFDQEVAAATEPEWISDRIVLLRPHHVGYEENKIIDIGDSSIRSIDGGTHLALDSKGNNYATIYGDLNWFVPEHGPGSVDKGFVRAKSGQSVFLRYNGYWVYPKPLEAWRNSKEYESGKWQKRIAKNETVLTTWGVKTDNAWYDISAPVFVGDTAWCAFIERMYESGKPDPVKTNLVLLNADQANTNPPKEEHIQIKKKALPSISVDDLSRDVLLKWNSTDEAVEIWKANRKNREYLQKFGNVAIDVKNL